MFTNMSKIIIHKMTIILAMISLTSCGTMPTKPNRSNYRPSTTSLATWDKLQRTSSTKLAALHIIEPDTTRKAWINLALISKRNSVNTQKLAQELGSWRTQNPSHPGNELLPNDNQLTSLQNSPQPKHIAILLPQNGPFARAGQKLREGFLNAYYANMAKAGKVNVKFYDTSNTQNMAVLYQQAVAEGAEFVIGPLLKNHVQQLSATTNFQVPTLALNYSETRNTSLPTNFYEFGLLPEDEAAQIADRAHNAGLNHAIIIAPQDAFGKRLVTAFSTRWQALGGSVQDTMYFNDKSDLNQNIADLLHVNPKADKQLRKHEHGRAALEAQRRQDVDVIFLFTQPQQAHLIVPLLKYYYAGKLPIYATSSVYDGKPNPTKDVDLNGVIVCDIPWNMRVAQGTENQIQTDRMYAVGQDAYILSETLQRLKHMPDFPIYGYTGALTLSSTQQIHRRLPCTIVHDGHL